MVKDVKHSIRTVIAPPAVFYDADLPDIMIFDPGALGPGMPFALSTLLFR